MSKAEAPKCCRTRLPPLHRSPKPVLAAAAPGTAGEVKLFNVPG